MFFRCIYNKRKCAWRTVICCSYDYHWTNNSLGWGISNCCYKWTLRKWAWARHVKICWNRLSCESILIWCTCILIHYRNWSGYSCRRISLSTRWCNIATWIWYCDIGWNIIFNLAWLLTCTLIINWSVPAIPLIITCYLYLALFQYSIRN